MCAYAQGAPDTPLTDAQADALADFGDACDMIRTVRTLQLPATAGVTFGIVSGFADGTAHRANTTLTRTEPGGDAIAEAFGLTIDDTATVDRWTLDTADGPLEGTYRYETRRADRRLYDVTFDVITPEACSGPLPDCVPEG